MLEGRLGAAEAREHGLAQQALTRERAMSQLQDRVDQLLLRIPALEVRVPLST